METAASHTLTFTACSVRYIRDYVNGSTENTGNHWVEIQAWGRATVAYVGNYFEWYSNGANSSNRTMARYDYAGGQRVAMRHSDGTGANGLVFLLSDHLGRSNKTLDPAADTPENKLVKAHREIHHQEQGMKRSIPRALFRVYWGKE